MSTAESIGPYSPTTIYGQLTSPFTPKLVSINSHTPFDKTNEEESKVFSRDYFEGRPVARMKYSLPETAPAEITKYQPEQQNSNNTNNDTKQSEKPQTELTAFSMSATSSSDIVKSSLKQGYSTEQAVVISKAQSAYQRSATLTKDPVGVLGSCNYMVS